MSEDRPRCELCGELMPEGEEMFNYHGYSGPCPKPPLPKPKPVRSDLRRAAGSMSTEERKAYMREYHRLHPETRRNRGSNLEYLEWRREYNRTHPPKPETIRLCVANYVARHPERAAAQQTLRSAIRRGEIKRPEKCSKCGLAAKRKDGHSAVQAHHPDYSKPLEVLWLCPLCHKAEHRRKQ